MLPILKHCFTRRIFHTLAFEILALNACFLLLIYSRVKTWETPAIPLILTALFAASNSLVVQFSLWSFGLYSREVVYSGRRVFHNLTASFLFSAVLLIPVCFLFSFSADPIFHLTPKFYFFALLGFTSVIALERSLVLRVFDESSYMGNVLILGSGPATDQVVAEARRHHGKTFRLVGVLSENAEDVGQAVDGCRVIGTIHEIQEVVEKRDVKAILISMPIYSPHLPADFLLKCKLNGIAVLDSSEFYETLGKRVLLEKLNTLNLLLSENVFMTRFRWTVKAWSEKLIAVLILLLSSPVVLLAALLVKLTSPGRVLYKQERVGKDGKVFLLYKFRSMVNGAERNGEAVWALKNDPRVTPVGKLLRKFRIDELPQLLNVLRGEMGIVGPRPERPEFVGKLSSVIPFYDDRHLVLPGITGWAQVVYPYGSSVEDAREKLRYDLYYIKSMSFIFDIMIVLSTIRTVLFARGAR